MSLGAALFYFFDFIIFIAYFLFKFIRRKYIFSCFNVSLFIYYFSIFISPVFYSAPESWAALGVSNHQEYYEYLDRTIILNSIGFIVSIFAMAIIEFSKNKKGIKKVIKGANKINDALLETFFWIFVITWYFIVLVFNGGLPLFNSGRTFFLGSLISPIYQALNQIILIYTLYYGIYFIYKEKFKTSNFIKTVLCIATLLFTGNRGTVLLSAFVPIALLFVIESSKRKYNKVITTRSIIFSWRIHALIKIIIILFIALAVGLLLSALRSGGSINIASMIAELIYGNTFSDMRDGAFILSGFDNALQGEFLYGKTYLAGILSFIPSSISPFMVEWRWGRFSTSMLFGWSDHFGLRGGNGMEAYLNFGIVGVVIFSIGQGILSGFFEKIFYHLFFIKERRSVAIKMENIMIVIMCISSLSNFLGNTAALYNIYVCAIFYILVCLPIRIRRRTHIDYKANKIIQ